MTRKLGIDVSGNYYRNEPKDGGGEKYAYDECPYCEKPIERLKPCGSCPWCNAYLLRYQDDS